VGSVTVFFALLERMGPRARQALDWDVPALPRLLETDRSRWNRVSQLTGEVILLLWWLGVLKIGLPHGWSFSLYPAALWPDLYLPVIGLLCAGIAIDLAALARPDAYVPRAVAYIATRLGWLALAAFVWASGPQLTLAAPHLTSRQIVSVELGLVWTIRVTVLVFFVTMIAQAALEVWRLARRLGRRNGGAALQAR
jgi:hypothetical protein